jgi:protein subunit release factor B
MAVSRDKQRILEERMAHLGIREEDISEQFVLSSGPGGQNVNKRSTCVMLKHIPTGIEVKCQEERYREMNRYRARQRLCDKYEELILKLSTPKTEYVEKIRRRKKRRDRRRKARDTWDKSQALD